MIIVLLMREVSLNLVNIALLHGIALSRAGLRYISVIDVLLDQDQSFSHQHIN